MKEHKHKWFDMSYDDDTPQMCIDGTQKIKCLICGTESSKKELMGDKDG